MKRLTYSIREINEIIAPRNIKCLSEEYINNKMIMKWKCLVEECGHEWETRALCILQGTGCPRCALSLRCEPGTVYTIEKINEMLSPRKIECTSSEYVSNKVIMTWKCLVEGCGCAWKSNWINIHNGNGCHKCGNKKRGLTFLKWNIEKINEFLYEYVHSV